MTLTEQTPESIVSAEVKTLIVAGIPAFNEEKTIAKVVLQAQQFADVVLVCDDGSSDMTSQIAKRLGATVVSHDKNLGYGSAIKTLFLMAKDLNADILVTLDGDGQHDPREIPKSIQPVLDNDVDVVLGSRFLGLQANEMPRYRRFGIKIVSKLTCVATNHNFKDTQCGFRVYGSRALKSLQLEEDGMGSSVEILMKAKRKNLKIIEVSTKCKYSDLERTSTQNPIRHGISLLTSLMQFVVEEKPLTLLGLPGLIFILTGCFFGAWMLKIFATDQRIVTNIALASIAFILIGMFTLFTAITLYAISRQSKRIKK